MKPREWWLAGEANEHDVGIWYDHNPGNHVVTDEPFCRYHVIEKSAYDELLAEAMKLRIALEQYRLPSNFLINGTCSAFDKFLADRGIE